MKCRGPEVREQIVKDYSVTPLIHLPLLDGQTKLSDAEATLKNEYYIFRCVHRQTGTEARIVCGKAAAEHFLILTGQEKLPLRSVYAVEPGSGTSSNHSIGENLPTIKNKKWDPVAKQLHDALLWLMILWDAHDVVSGLFKLEANIAKYYYCEPYVSKIRSVNTMIRNGCHGKTLTQKIDERKTNRPFREFSFDLLAQKLETEKVQSFF